MTTDTVRSDATECVGKFEMKVAPGRPTRDAEERWGQRVDALALWLIAEWEQEQVAMKEAC
jgi:hypothetical protein